MGRYIILVTVLAVVVGLAPGAFSAPLSVVWVTDDTPGGHWINGGGNDFDVKKPGIEIELYRMVAERLGFDLTLKRMPWNRCLQLIEHNKVDGIFPASFKKERMGIGVYPMAGDRVDASRKTRNNAYYLYKLASSVVSWDGNGFQGVSGNIGVPIGWAIVEDLKPYNLPLKEVPIHQHTPDLLLQKRLDGFICLETVFDAYLKRRPDTSVQIVKVEPPIWEKPYYLMLSRQFVADHPDLSRKVWDTIMDIKSSDRFAEIVDRYVD